MTDLESRLKRALDASYRVERELGAGGIATVYASAVLVTGSRAGS